MGKVIKMEVQRVQVFTDLTEMLNAWWKTLAKKPISVKPVSYTHLTLPTKA